MTKVAKERPNKPPKPIARRLDAKALRKTIELADKKELSKALAGRSVDSFIEGAVQLFNVSVADPYYDADTYIELEDIDFMWPNEYTYTMRWCVDKNRIYMFEPALVTLYFSVPSKAYYLIGIHAARYKGGDYKANYNLYLPKGIEGSLNMDNRPLMEFDPPLPVIAYIDTLNPNRFWFSGHYLLFESISVWKF